jgi:hypothetical protein
MRSRPGQEIDATIAGRGILRADKRAFAEVLTLEMARPIVQAEAEVELRWHGYDRA